MERRFEQYAFIAAVAALGATYGAACDLVTSSISPEYFAIAKHTRVAGAAWRAALIGARAGAGGGALAALVLVVADEPRWGGAGAPLRNLARAVMRVAIASAMCAVGCGVVGGSRIVRARFRAGPASPSSC